MPKKYPRKLPPLNQTESTPEEGDTIPGRELLDALASMHSDPKYSDLTIVCGSESHAVHRCIVCPRSEFFAAACDDDFCEAFTRVINLDKEEPVLVRQMIQYLYTLDYQNDCHVPTNDSHRSDEPTISEPYDGQPPLPDPSAHSPPEIEGVLPDSAQAEGSCEPSSVPTFNPLSFHILMYSLADRMLIHGLKALSQQNVEQELVQHLDADMFPQAILEIYNSTPKSDRGLRDVAVKVTMGHLTMLRKEDETGNLIFKKSLLESVPQFTYDLLLKIMNKSTAMWDKGGAIQRDWSGW
ncbi:hypothetical protein BDV26DRAFT_156017 [Aspergillus bertholletiae]|uniref:BTB domain-containing protein n=1 Tax=Aspergillus bertholletiae TaxID=1226010 RepID=A0A5N7BD54_9EURO|nr:hypothetical protein BDV26DRAFT_156017 [Aspergillus bertholletiae]